MNNQITSNVFATRDELASKLSDEIATQLSGAVAEKGRAILAVSGGSTPKLLFQTLSEKDIEWSKVTIILVDERYVAPDDDRSNERLVRENLLNGPAASANLIGFWIDGKNAIEAKEILDKKVAHLGGFDIVILGMGLDGHTASFFPGGNNLELATNPSCPCAIIDMEAAGAGEPRLTITLPVIMNAQVTILHIEGDGKKQVLDQAMANSSEENLPIRTVINALSKPISLFWAP